MKSIFYLFGILFLISCSPSPSSQEATPPLDIEAELKKIDQLRLDFQQTVKEKRYGDLGKFVTKDVISIGPGSEDWIAYRKLRETYGNQFRYDSIFMRPKETVIVSDSIAYDFGVSSVYYTDENGVVHEMEDSFLVILKRNKAGEWKLFREMASSLVP